MCLSLRSGLWISLWEYFSLHTITFFFLESRPRGLQNNCTSAWFDHLLPCLLQNLRFFDCFQYIAIVVLSLVKWSEFADVTEKLQNFENRRVDQVDINNYNYLENAYFVMLFLSRTPSPDGLALLADLFPIWPLFLPFSPTAEPGPSQATQMVSQIQTQLTISLVREVHPHMRPDSPQSVCSSPWCSAIMIFNFYNDFIFRVISLISVLDFFFKVRILGVS